MSALRRDHVLLIDDLLARIRACIVDTPSAAIVSLTINVGMTGKTKVVRFCARPDGSWLSLSAEEPVSSPSSESLSAPSAESSPQRLLPARCDAPQRSADMERDEEQRDKDNSSSNGVDDETSSVAVDDHDGADTRLQSAPEDGSEPAMPASTSAPRGDDTSAASAVVQSSPSLHSIRRSARQQHPPDRLAYPTAASSVSVQPKQMQGTKRTAETYARPAAPVDAVESTDTESAEASGARSSSSSSSRRQQHKKRRKHDDNADMHRSVLCSDDSGEQEPVAALAVKLREGHARRQKELDWHSVSKQVVLQLARDILQSGAGQLDEDDPLAYQHCATKIDILVSASTAMRMVGYYLRSVLAARLKRSHKNKYVRSARTLLGLKSSADITAYPAFYSFVQQHCPSVANGEMDLEAWLQEPIFLADIGWAEWRRYLGKSHRWIIDSAIEQCAASLQPARDWMQRGWVEEYDDPRLGRGLRALCAIPLPTSNRVHHSMAVDGGDNVAVAADLCLLALAQEQRHESTGQQHQQAALWYRFEWDGGKQQLDAEQLWVGKINHLPMPLCNLKLTGNGKLVQRRAVDADEPLTFDYGVQWWAHRVTGVTWNHWLTTGTGHSRKGSADLFYRMHESVLDYTPLLAMEWDQRLSTATSELEREQVMMEIWEQVDERGHDCDSDSMAA